MKQAQSARTSRLNGRWWINPSAKQGWYSRTDRPRNPVQIDLDQSALWLAATGLRTLLGVVGFMVLLPFRLVFSLIAWLGRVTALVIGFCLMVAGMALLAGPFFWFGIPLFIIGLVLTLRCLD
jgi:hypothetical protein